ncbi:MAG: signal peptidase II [Sedimentisphaerales bacterium]
MAAPLNQQNNLGESRCCPAVAAVSAHLLFWSLLVAGIILDLWSKKAVFAWLQSRGQTGFSIINGILRLQLAENSGAAFGMAAGQRTLLIAVSAVALVVLLAVFLFAGTDRKITQVALALFAAGVCGNLYDRIFHNGLVRDFIDVVYWPGKHWPAFNVADSLLCVAVGLLILSGLTGRQSCQKPAQPQK